MASSIRNPGKRSTIKKYKKYSTLVCSNVGFRLFRPSQRAARKNVGKKSGRVRYVGAPSKRRALDVN